MIPPLTQSMVDGMDDTAGLLRAALHPAPPPSPFLWKQDSRASIAASLPKASISRDLRPRSDSYPIESREASEKSTNKRAALIRGGI